MSIDWMSFEEKMDAWEIYYLNRCRTLSPIQRAKWYIKFAPYEDWLRYKARIVEITKDPLARPEDFPIDTFDVLCQNKETSRFQYEL